MAIINAMDFVRRAGSDKELRKLCNRSKSKEALLHTLGFNIVEFEDAINMRLLKCQTYEEAEEFQEIRIWFYLL